MGPSETAYQDEPKNIGRAVDKKPSELERAYANLDKQEALLGILRQRLEPVSHNQPTEPNAGKPDTYPHVSSIADRIAGNNKEINNLIEKLAV